MAEPRDHMHKRGSIESILRVIPGFKGYLEKEYRRDSDALARAQLATRLEQSKRGIDAVTRALTDAGQLAALPQFDRVRGRIDKLIGRIRGAVQGYSGFFDLVQVDEALLDRVYDLDLGLLDEIDLFADQVEKLAAGPENPQAAALQLIHESEQLEQKWNRRDELLRMGD